MTIHSRSTETNWRRLRSLPLAKLAPVLAVAAALLLLPARVSTPLKGALGAGLAPGRRLASSARQRAVRHWNLLRRGLATAEEQQALAAELRRQSERNAELELALALAQARHEALAAQHAERSVSAPLVHAELVRANVLGPQTRSFLQRKELLDVGSLAQLAAGTLVVASPPAVLDQGRNVGLKVDDLTLTGRRVAGKLVEVGPQTSTLARPTDSGYRDLVQLAQAGGDRVRLGAKGVLEGLDEPLCRINLVEITEPVSTGDLVLAAGESGAASTGALYGRVVRVERRAGDAHWRIWMEPAVGRDLPDEVAVLRLQLNPARVAGLPALGRTK